MKPCQSASTVQTILFFLFQGALFWTWRANSDIASTLCKRGFERQGFESPRVIPSKGTVKSEPMPFNRTRIDVEVDALHLGSIRPRIWDTWPLHRKLPCPPVEKRWWHHIVQRAPTKRGLLFVKEMKTGSSSVGGIVIRIARNLPKRYGYDFDQCSTRFDHCPARTMKYKQRIRPESFLFTFVREPSTRFISQFFHFMVSRQKFEPSDYNIQAYFVKNPYLHDYYLNDLSLSSYLPKNLSSYEKLAYRLRAANAIVHDYDFIGVTERMDESLVVLQLLLHLPTSDIMHLNAKSNGGFDDGAFNSTCVYIVPSYTSPNMKTWLENSSVWKDKIRGDEMLYNAAYQSLDLTIDSLGRKLFEEKLQKFRRAQKLAQEKCSFNLTLPCSPEGVRAKVLDVNKFVSDCLWLDSGCGYKCLDEISDEVDNM